MSMKMEYGHQEQCKRHTRSSPALRISVMVVTAVTATAISLFVSFSLFLATLGYYRMQPHYLSDSTAAPAYEMSHPEIHAAPDESGHSLKTGRSEAFESAYPGGGNAVLFRPVLEMTDRHNDPLPRPFFHTASVTPIAKTMRPLLATGFSASSGDILFELASAAFPDHRQVVSGCPWLCDLLYGIAMRYGIPESALTMEVIQPSIMQQVTVTRITAFLTAAQTPEILYQAIEGALQGTGISIIKRVLSDQRTLLQAYYENTVCAELLCIIPAQEFAYPGKLPPAAPPADGLDAEGLEDSGASSTAANPQDTLIQGDVSDAVPDGPYENTPENDSETACPEGEVPITGYMAIILDDGGYGGNELERVLNLDNRLTLSILPDTPFGREAAERGQEKGFEIMLHMPMQSGTGTKNRFPGEIQVTMTKEQVQQRARECIAQYPEAVGINNHTGGLFTTYGEQMGWFLEIAQEEGMYFVDSRTVGNSRAYDKAIEMGIPCASRDIFLDHNNSIAEVRKRFNELVALTKRNGWAVSIGHFRPNTITVLAEELPKLASQGVALIPMSEMVW